MPDRFVAAANQLKRPAYFSSAKHKADLLFKRDGGDPRLVKLTDAVLRAAHAHLIPVRCFNIYRSREEQADMLKRGVTKAPPGASPHNFGLAVDLIHAELAWDMTPDQWRFLAVIVTECARRQNLRLTWGGTWRWNASPMPLGEVLEGKRGLGWDPAHFELERWRSDPAATGAAA
nr:MAG: CwlK [Microvirus sp.]